MNNTFSKKETLEKLLVGVNVLADIVKTTMGSKGYTYLIRKPDGTPYITKDGVSIAKTVVREDPIEQLGCRLLQQAAQLTVEQAGDGTSATTTVAQALIQGVIERLKSRNHRELFLEIEEALVDIEKILLSKVRRIKSLKDCIRIATISTNDEELGTLVGTVMWEARDNGVVQLEESENTYTDVYQEKGSRYERPYEHKALLGISETKIVYNNPIVLVLENDVQSFNDILEDIEESTRLNRPLVIIAPDFAKIVINALIYNSAKNGIHVLPLYIPGYGDEKREYFNDILSLVENDNVEKVAADKFGFTIFTKQFTKEMEHRSKYLVTQIAQESTKYYKEVLEKRLSIINQKVFTVNVGATSPIEMLEKKDRIEDGLLATRCALDAGYVLGGGVALRNVRRTIYNKYTDTTSMTDGMKILTDAITAPFRQILNNADVSFSVFFSELEETDGFNTTTMEVENFYRAGIIDPYKVIINAVRNAVSVVKTIISINGTIIENESTHLPQFHEDRGFI